MTRYGLLCLFIGTLALGQATMPNSTPAQRPMPAGGPPAKAGAAAMAESKPADVPPNTPVVTIKGLCNKPAADKTPPATCTTTITRAEFEKVVDAVQPTMAGRARRQFAVRYADTLVMSKRAEEMGLDKGPGFEERMQLARIQVLAQSMGKALQEKASQISDADIEAYYHKNASNFEQAEMDRIYIPRTQQPPETDMEKKLSETDEEKHQQESEKIMKDEADKLHARAVAGDDFNKLQTEAYDTASIKTGSPNTGMGKTRRSMLPPTQISVMDLKPGEVSAVIDDQNGYFIYKLKSKEVMPLDQAREEIRGTLRSQRIQESMKSMQESATSTFDDAYFGPEATPPGGAPMRPGMPLPPIKPPAPGPR